MGREVGKSLCEKDLADTARRILQKAETSGCKVILPLDGVVAREFKPDAENKVEPVDAIDPEGMILDIGPASVEAVNKAIDGAATLIWNGPVGAFETKPFDKGTMAIARHVAERTGKSGLISVAGGGDTVAALAAAGVEDRLTYVSTAGGAFLEWMEGKALPGVEALRA
jgi:phosphoglycerate kinase